MQREQSFRKDRSGRRSLSLTLALGLIAAALAPPASAQRIGPEPGLGKPPSGVGGGAGVIAPLPPLPPAMSTPTLPAPEIAPPTAVPQVTPAAPAPARVVRFRCEVAPNDESCRKPGAGDDGGGGDDECSCTRDYCHTTEAGIRVCEKLQ